MAFEHTNDKSENKPYEISNTCLLIRIIFLGDLIERTLNPRLCSGAFCQGKSSEVAMYDSTVTRLRTGRQQNRSFFLDRHRNFHFRYRVQAGFEAHPTTYPMCTRGSFLGDTADRA